MRKSQTVIGLALIMAVSGLALAGCSSSQPKSTASASPSYAGSTPSPGEPVVPGATEGNNGYDPGYKTGITDEQVTALVTDFANKYTTTSNSLDEWRNSLYPLVTPDLGAQIGAQTYRAPGGYQKVIELAGASSYGWNFQIDCGANGGYAVTVTMMDEYGNKLPSPLISDVEPNNNE